MTCALAEYNCSNLIKLAASSSKLTPEMELRRLSVCSNTFSAVLVLLIELLALMPIPSTY
jgi:hypothetical protein